MALAGVSSPGISASSSPNAKSAVAADPTGLDQIAACLQMMGEPTASTMIGKLQGLEQTAHANPAQAQADMAELAQCLEMMPQGAGLIEQLKALVGPSLAAADDKQLDSFSPAGTMSVSAAPEPALPPSATPDALWSSGSGSSASGSMSSILKAANESPLS